MISRAPCVGVIGGSAASPEQLECARMVGRLLAAAGVDLVTGGGAGVMEAACEGAAGAGGLTIGILPGDDRGASPPNPFVRIPVYTGLGDARNAVIVRTASVLIAIGGGAGTLSEIGLALKAGRPVILLHSWEVRPPAPAAAMMHDLHRVESPEQAAALAVSLLSRA